MPNVNSASSLDDKAILADALASEKQAAGNYNRFTDEAVTAKVRQGFLALLSEEHELHNSLFQEMNKRGWYPVTQAEQKKVDEIRNRFQNN